MLVEIPHGGHPEHELHAFGMPAVEMLRLREVGVAAQADLPEAGPAAEVTRRRRIGNPTRPQGVEVGLVGPQEFEMLRTWSDS
jgi:hypothetical protein